MNATQTIQAFIEKHGLSIESQLLKEPPADVSAEDRKRDPNRSYWTVTIKREGGKPLTTSFNQGSAFRRWKQWANGLTQREVTQRARGERATPQGGRETVHFVENTEPMPPALADVLDCLRSDSQSFANALDFEEWAAEFGYDTDSRKAEQTYQACGKIAAGLQRLLGAAAYNELLEETESL
jgi:hypothetical protein